ncbi:MAG: hypothetical protein LAT51_02995 [Flavobacteriaceae bacterium]|nr:hypothetical protein [Flavobacteriaceae bacterium]
MDKKQKTIVALLVLAIAVMIYWEVNSPEPLDFSSDYTFTSTKALGSKAFHDAIENSTFDSIQYLNKSVYEAFMNNEINQGTLIFVNGYSDISDIGWKKLKDWVSEGNQLLISNKYFSKPITEEYKFETRTLTNPQGQNYFNAKIRGLSQQEFPTGKYITQRYFIRLDSIQADTLGLVSEMKSSKESYPNFIKINEGKGQIYLHTHPESFGNFFFLRRSHYAYVEEILEQFETHKNLYLDAYFKSGKQIATSPLQYMLKNRALKWMFYSLIVSILILLIFMAKRKQRTIPVVLPYPNKSVEFIRTISDVFQKKQTHAEFVSMKIDQLQKKWFLDYGISKNPSDEELQTIAQKKEIDINDIKNDLKQIKKISNKLEIEQRDLKKVIRIVKKYM